MSKQLSAAKRVHQHFLEGYGSLVQIDLPVHQPSGGQIVLDGIDAFGVHHQFIVHNIEHFDDACRTDVALSNSCEERVSPQIVQAVHVELRGDEFVEEFFGVVALEDFQSQVECPLHLLIDLFHHQERYFLMGDTRDECVLQYVREGTVSYIVHQNSSLHGFCL